MFQSIINPLQVSWGIWFITLGCAFINGLSKSGLKGVGMVTIPILAYFYGGMMSAGLLLPFLILTAKMVRLWLITMTGPAL